MSGPGLLANVTTNASSACDAWVTAPLTTSCGVGVCSNATGVPTCVCSPGWSGVGDFDFRHLPLQDADCDKYPVLFRVLYFIGAAASFINFFCAAYMWWDARNKKGRKKTTAMIICVLSVVGFILWGFRGIDPGRSIGVDPALTIMFAFYLFLAYFGFSYVLGTSTYIGVLCVVVFSCFVSEKLVSPQREVGEGVVWSTTVCTRYWMMPCGEGRGGTPDRVVAT